MKHKVKGYRRLDNESRHRIVISTGYFTIFNRTFGMGFEFCKSGFYLSKEQRDYAYRFQYKKYTTNWNLDNLVCMSLSKNYTSYFLSWMGCSFMFSKEVK